MEEIQSRLAFVSSARQLDGVKKSNYRYYLRLPWLGNALHVLRQLFA
jgi:hypothetical protein